MCTAEKIVKFKQKAVQIKEYYLRTKSRKLIAIKTVDIIGADYMGSWGLDSPLGSTTRGLNPPENCGKEYFLVVKITEP